MKAIPVVVRERILKLYEQGKGTREIAASFGYCVAAVRRVRQHFKERGTLEPQTHRCGRKTLLTEARQTRLERLLARRPDATLAELGAQFNRPTSTMDLWLSRLGWSCKKNAARRGAVAARRGRTKEAVAATAGGRTGHTLGVRGHLHSVARRHYAGGRQRFGPLNLHQANPARTDRLHVLQVAQRRYVDVQFLRGLEDG